MYRSVILSLLLIECLVNSEDNITTTYKPKNYINSCIAESKADRSDVDKFILGKFVKSNVALKKWVLCYLSMRGVMSPAGVLSQDVVLKNIGIDDKKKVEQIINKCLYKTAHDPVDTAWKYITCFRNRASRFTKLSNGI